MEVTKKQVEKIIELRNESTFLNHLWNVISRDFRTKGEIGQNEIRVWRQNMWNMSFYPIFTFRFDDNKKLFKISNELNPIGKTIIALMAIGFLYLIFPKKLTDFAFDVNWQGLTIIAVFILLLVLVARKIYSVEKNNQLEQIFVFLEIGKEKKTVEKEWTLKSTFFRLFSYPFSLFVISICMWQLFENGINSIMMTLFGIGVCGLYLYSDIKMIMKNSKTTAKKK